MGISRDCHTRFFFASLTISLQYWQDRHAIVSIFTDEETEVRRHCQGEMDKRGKTLKDSSSSHDPKVLPSISFLMPFPKSMSKRWSSCPPRGRGLSECLRKDGAGECSQLSLSFYRKNSAPRSPCHKPAVFWQEWEKRVRGIILGWALESGPGRVERGGEKYYSSLSSVFQVLDVHHLIDCSHPPWGHQYHFHPLSEETESQRSWVPKFSIIRLRQSCVQEMK